MSVIWILERAEAPHPKLASALIGDYAVRAFASLSSFSRLLRLSRCQMPNMLLIDAAAAPTTLAPLSAILSCHLPKTPIVYITSKKAPDGQLSGSATVPGLDVSNLHVYHPPVDGLNLSAFIKGILQSSEASDQRSIIRYRGVMLDYHRLEYQVEPSAVASSLPRKEAQLLRLLFEQPGICLSREAIRDTIWEQVKVTPRTIDSHMSRLRQRLEGTEVQILSVYGGGYVLK